MKTIKSVSIIIILLILGGWIVVSSLTISVPIGQVGVRIQQYGMFGAKGVVEEDFGAGWHRDLGPIDKWQLYDSTVQTLEMTKDPRHGSVQGRDDVRVTSSDGSAISLDVTVKYRVAAGQAHILYQDLGSGTRYRTIVRNEAENACMGLFGQLETEDFYNPAKKASAAVAARALLKEKLEPKSIEVIDLLIRDVEFGEEYEQKIRQKKLADQEVELQIAEAAAAGERGKTQVVEADTAKRLQIIRKEKDRELIRMKAETDLAIAKIQAAYELYVTEKKADADLEAAQKVAAGERLVKVAEAEGEKLRNAALMGAGGSIIVALEAAKNLNISEALISTIDTDLLDIDAMAEKLGVPPEE